MNPIDADVQNIMSYSQSLDSILALATAGLLYIWRLESKLTFGIFEIGFGSYLVHFAAVPATGAFSRDFGADFDVAHMIIALSAYFGAVFFIIRGIENIHLGSQITPEPKKNPGLAIRVSEKLRSVLKTPWN